MVENNDLQSSYLDHGDVTLTSTMLLQRFEARLRETPNAAAVVDDYSIFTYAQLDLESRRYSGLLLANNVGRESVVAIVADRGPQYVAMMLGVHRSGAAFMPVEPTTPVTRGRLMCATGGIQAILAQTSHERYAANLVNGSVPQTIVKAIPPLYRDHLDRELRERENGGLAYVIFTSGSSGVPKGAMITDRGMNNHLAAKTLDLDLGSSDIVGFTAPLTFDISIWQALCPLSVGGSVCVASPTNLSEPAELVAWIERHGVTILEIIPSFLTVVLDLLSTDKLRSSLRSLRFLISTGEALPIQLAGSWYNCCPSIRLLNAYGPTECSDDVSHHIVTEEECRMKARPSIGREILNTNLYIVDALGQQTNDGIEGELWVGGHSVGRGYIADPVGTALAFIPDNLSGRSGERLYRTGDRASRASDRRIDYLGRRDRQVKVRGHRVELGDVESALICVNGVTCAACVFTRDRIRAFVTLQSGSEDLERRNAILKEVRKLAPPYLVPHEVKVLERFPTGASGKVDYRALERLVVCDVENETNENSDRPTRMASIKAIFAETLGVLQVYDEDNFFVAGGDSLQAMMLMSLIREQFGNKDVSLRRFLADPTPRGLLENLEAAKDVTSKEPDQLNSVDSGALSSGQERLCFLEQLHPRRGGQLLRLELTLRGPLILRGLQYALDAVVIRHEPLRTVFSREVGVPIGKIWPWARIVLECVKARAGEIPTDLLSKSGLSAFTKHPPLAVAQLLEIGWNHHILTLVMHHLVADGWSLAVLGRDISKYYQQWIDGNLDVSIPPITYTNYINEERQWLKSNQASECERYWSEELAGAPLTINLPLDRPRLDSPDFTANQVIDELSVGETTELANTSRKMMATPFMAVIAAFYITLRKLTGTDDLVIGIDAANRSWTGSDQLVGTFVNQLPVRLSCPVVNPSFRDVLAVARKKCLGAYQHERLPFHKIVAAINPPRRAGRFPLFQVKVTQQGAWRSSLKLSNIQVTPTEISEPMTHFDLMLDVSGEHDRLRLELVYRPEVLDHEKAESWVRKIGNVLRAGGSNRLRASDPFPPELGSWT